MYTVYGISSCSTVSKARRFLEEKGHQYEFHDFKTHGVDEGMISKLETQVGWEIMLNKRSTTWRQLDDAQKTDVNQQKAIALMVEKPTLIKRPLLDTGEQILVGFKAEEYEAL
ncbi:MAG: ArsC family reductase [Methylococcaceae bacterium]|nr:ArsC family reductase [Methylococcaceae bacterium]